MMRAAALALALASLAAAPARAQDSTPAPRTGVVRPRAAQPRTTARNTAPVRPARRTTRPQRPPAPDTARDTLRAVAPAPPPGFVRVMPETVTVGDRFASGMVVNVPAGARVALVIPRDTADRWRVLGDVHVTPLDSARNWVMTASMVAWQPGLPDTLPAVIRLTAADGTVAEVRTVMGLPVVRAVLPADSAKWRVKPPHDVWGPSVDAARTALTAALLALALVLLALLAWMVAGAVRRRRARRIPATARERALALLERARTSGFVEAGNWKAFYTLIAEALRGYIAVVEPPLGEDLTSREVTDAMRAAGRAEERIEPLEHLLRVSDLAKFARHGRAPDDARRDLDLAREWIETYAAPADPAMDQADAAVTAEAAP